MAFSDEVSFLEQQIQLLNRGALQEALHMASARLQNLKLGPQSTTFDPKVRSLYFQLYHLVMTMLANVIRRCRISEYPPDFC
jgi:hypothetical protein